MSVTLHSFAKINIGLAIGPRREDGFHELSTIYQSIALHDVVKVKVEKGDGIEIRCKDPRVPSGESNTCWRMAETMLRGLEIQRKVTIRIEKRLPVQGGLAGASSNAVAVLLGIERALRIRLPLKSKLELAAVVGSDLPLFLIGGTVMGTGRGEKVVEAPDLPVLGCVVVAPEIGISTPAAFAAWDKMAAPTGQSTGLTEEVASDRIKVVSRMLRRWLRGTTSGVPGAIARDRAEALLLDLVRTGIENDFEAVVFPQHPELREVKKLLLREGAGYASLSGSGSAVYGLFASPRKAAQTAARLRKQGIRATATQTLPRREYWRKM